MKFQRPPTRVLEDTAAEQNRRETARAIEQIQKHIEAVPKFPTAARSYLGRQVFTATGTYTPTKGTRAVLLKMVGGGGGGGGTTGGASFAFAGGGWAGDYIEKYIESVTPISGGAITIGAGGAAGAAGGNGGTGGDSTAAINGVTYTAKGGIGGVAMANGAGAAVTGITAGATGSSSGVDVIVNAAGEQGIRIAAGAGWSGMGGNTPLGSGGCTTAVGNGTSATGYGGGGGGSQSGANNQTGGGGGSGIVIIEEFS